MRYPEDSTDITGIIYEPWHYRYVGPEMAEEIMERGITMEEDVEEKATVNELPKSKGNEFSPN